MNDQIGLLVQRQKILILVNDIQRNRLGDDFVDRLRRRDHFHLIANPRVITGLCDFSIDLDQPLIDQPLHARAREIADAIDEQESSSLDRRCHERFRTSLRRVVPA